jgi:hypothetical protein
MDFAIMTMTILPTYLLLVVFQTGVIIIASPIIVPYTVGSILSGFGNPFYYKCTLCNKRKKNVGWATDNTCVECYFTHKDDKLNEWLYKPYDNGRSVERPI